MALDLKALGAKIATVAFSVADSIADNATYTRPAKGYNTTTGVVTNTNTTYPVNVILLGPEVSQTNSQLGLTKDVKRAMVRQAELPIVPKMDDYITLANGTVYHVIEYKQDPASATYTIWLRTGS